MVVDGESAAQADVCKIHGKVAARVGAWQFIQLGARVSPIRVCSLVARPAN